MVLYFLNDQCGYILRLLLGGKPVITGDHGYVGLMYDQCAVYFNVVSESPIVAFEYFCFYILRCTTRCRVVVPGWGRA